MCKKKTQNNICVFIESQLLAMVEWVLEKHTQQTHKHNLFNPTAFVSFYIVTIDYNNNTDVAKI